MPMLCRWLPFIGNMQGGRQTVHSPWGAWWGGAGLSSLDILSSFVSMDGISKMGWSSQSQTLSGLCNLHVFALLVGWRVT